MPAPNTSVGPEPIPCPASTGRARPEAVWSGRVVLPKGNAWLERDDDDAAVVLVVLVRTRLAARSRLWTSVERQLEPNSATLLVFSASFAVLSLDGVDDVPVQHDESHSDLRGASLGLYNHDARWGVKASAFFRVTVVTPVERRSNTPHPSVPTTSAPVTEFSGVTFRKSRGCENMTRSWGNPTHSFARSAAAVCPVLVLALGCATPRYLGTLSGGTTYVNRGYGLVLPLTGLTARWWIFDPEHPDQGPSGLAPKRKDDRIDLDADGMLLLDELTSRYEPALRLLSRTSTAARIDIAAEILSEPAASRVTLRGLLHSEIRTRAADAEAARKAIEGEEALSLAFGRPALVTTIERIRDGGAERLALIDQPGFVAEEGVVRRQLIRVRLVGPSLRPDWVEDHRRLVESLLAAPKAGAETRRERW